MITITDNETDFENLPLRLAYNFLESNGLGPDAEVIRTSHDRLGGYTTSLKRARILALLDKHNLVDTFVNTKWKNALTPDGRKLIDSYRRIYERYRDSGSTPSDRSDSDLADVPENIQTDSDNGIGGQFAMEEHLRDYLADNLWKLEQGLTRWPVENGDAVEFQVDDQGHSRRIDILAKDENGVPVVIELKVNRGHERTIGQVLYYRSRVKKKMQTPTVRIFIVAFAISPELRSAASEISDISLFEYNIGFSVATVAI
jgi:hypothetical protein